MLAFGKRYRGLNPAFKSADPISFSPFVFIIFLDLFAIIFSKILFLVLSPSLVSVHTHGLLYARVMRVFNMYPQ